MRITTSDLAETEYCAVADPEKAVQTAFGRFTHDPRFPERRDANQLQDVRCQAHEVEGLLKVVNELYENKALGFQKLSFHDDETVNTLKPALTAKGWSLQKTWMMLYTSAPKRPTNPNVNIKVVNPLDSEDLDAVSYHPKTNPAGVPHRRAQEKRLGGEVIVAYLNEKPIATTGWFVINNIARYRGVLTLPEARNKGVATTMIQYVQNHEHVKQQKALTLHVGEDGPIKLYEELGFQKHSLFWEALNLL